MLIITLKFSPGSWSPYDGLGLGRYTALKTFVILIPSRGALAPHARAFDLFPGIIKEVGVEFDLDLPPLAVSERLSICDHLCYSMSRLRSVQTLVFAKGSARGILGRSLPLPEQNEILRRMSAMRREDLSVTFV